MGTVSFEVPGPGTYQVECDPKLDPLAAPAAAGDVLAGKQFYNDQNQEVTGTLEPSGVSSFNGREGAVTPQTGDYTAPMVGARPDDWTPTPAEIGAATAASVAGKQDKLTGTQGQVVGFDANGNAIAQAAPSGGVTSFNGRTGAVTPQSGDYSVSQVTGAAPKVGPIFTGTIAHANNVQAGATCVIFGTNNQVGSNGSCAIGTNNIVYSQNSFAAGESCKAGNQTTPSEGICAHAEGYYTTASGKSSHAEGYITNASGAYSHAECNRTQAIGMSASATGDYTIAHEHQLVCGQYNVEKPLAFPTTFFIVGCGDGTARKNAFRVTSEGCYGIGAWNSSGADYAELFEWLDGNPEYEDRAGLFVTLDGEHIRIAGPEDDFIVGIVSATPSVVGDVYDDQWARMHMRDVFGRIIMEMQDFPAETIEHTHSDGTTETIEIRPARRELAPKINPEYDHTIKYQGRTERPEWDAVGMLGKLVAVDDGTCQVNGWATVGEGGKATASIEKTKYRVMSRLDSSHIRVLIV